MSMRKSDPQIFGGIYYVVRFPSDWKLITYQFESRDDDANHYAWWEQSVADWVATAWIKHTNLSQAQLLGRIKLLNYAFPRGRLSDIGGEHIFLYGADLNRAMGITKRTIEKAFGFEGRCRWEFDEHEQCLMDDKEEIRRLLNLKENWLAVSNEDHQLNGGM